jgi:hypothetical protein
MRYAMYLITVPLTFFAVYFALANPDDVKVALWPLAEQPFSLPLSLFGLGMLGSGFLLGALFVWLQYQRLRYRHWQEKRKTSRLEKELKGLQGERAAADNAAAAGAEPVQERPALAAK